MWDLMYELSALYLQRPHVAIETKLHGLRY